MLEHRSAAIYISASNNAVHEWADADTQCVGNAGNDTNDTYAPHFLNSTMLVFMKEFRKIAH